MPRVTWSPAARQQHNEIVVRIAVDSPPAAFSVHQKVLRATKRLERFPRSASAASARHAELSDLDQRYRLLVVRPYVIFYRVEGDQVRIPTVQHGAQRPPAGDVLTATE